MKKLILSALAALFCAQMISASTIIDNSNVTTSEITSVSPDQVQKASLIGTWKDNGTLANVFLSSGDDEDVDMKDAKVYFNFTANRMAINIDAAMDADGIAIAMKINANFSYTRSGKVLNVKFLSAKLASLDFKLEPDMEAALASQGLSKSKLTEMFKQQLGPEFEKEMANSELKNWDKLTITTLTNKLLVLSDGVETISLTRVK